MLFVHIFRGLGGCGKEEDQIGHKQEACQVDQVTGFEKDCGHGAFSVDPKWLQDDDCDDVYQKKRRNKNEMKQKIHACYNLGDSFPRYKKSIICMGIISPYPLWQL